jgi:divalent metal cation (Fe/Co/Zn/Cd) transporter
MKGHWRRLVVQVGLFVSGATVEFISQDVFVVVVALLIVALPIASWTVFGLLLWTSSQAPDIQSLYERVDDALTLALVSTLAAIVGLLVLGRLFHIIDAPVGPVITVCLGWIVVGVSIPALGFLRTWRDIYLPMVQRRRDARVEEEFEEERQPALARMEGRLQESIAENTRVSQEASDNAREAYREANTVNQKIARQGDALIAHEHVHED